MVYMTSDRTPLGILWVTEMYAACTSISLPPLLTISLSHWQQQWALLRILAAPL